MKFRSQILRGTISRTPLWVLLVLAVCALPARGQYDPDWARHFRIGMLVGFNVKADFKMTGASFGIAGGNPGPPGSGSDHFFDDGYVRVDDTGNAQGYTTFWGYQNSSQRVGDTLLYHSSSSFSTPASSVERDDGPFVGFDLAYGGNLWYWKDFRFGWELGFGLLPISVKDDRTLPASVSQSTFSFNVPPGVVLPSAPYNGGASGFGQPSIFDFATLVGATNVPGQITGSRELDVTLYTLRLGPSAFWDVSRYIGISASIGPAVGLVSGDYRFNETISTPNGPASNKGGFSDTQFVYGGYVNATVTYHAIANGDFYLGVQYMPMGSATFSKDGRSAELKLNGALYLSAGVNWPF